MVDNLLLKEGKVFVPASYALVPSLLDLAHGMGHDGIKKKHYTVSVQISISLAIAASSWNISAIVKSVNGTKLSI